MPGPRNHPGRFGVFANLPIPSDTEAALGELAYALDVLSAAVPPA
jgi:6-methylsalicylate decarboxylase